MSKEVVIIDGIRTPFAKMGTTLAGADAVELGRTAVQGLLTRLGFDPNLIDETIFGCVSQPVDAPNIARIIALRAGIPESKPAFTVQRNCASGLEAITTAADRIISGRGDVYLVGGTESMTRIPLLYKHRTALKFSALSRSRSTGEKIANILKFRPADFAPVVGLKLGLSDPVSGLNMGQTAELLAREFEIGRDEQDEFALRSHQLASAAAEKLAAEITPWYDAKSGKPVTADNGVREGQTMEALGKLKPVFERNTGTVTAGNASQITDGAVALLMMSREKADQLGLPALGRLVDYQYTGCDPAKMGLGPAHAIETMTKRSALNPSDADLLEINEAFAVQVLSCLKLLNEKGIHLDIDRLNVNGGAIALGHPVGASGARLALTALKELERREAKSALVSLCIGGGQGGAAWLERV
ncbi:MAG: thiolase family protein [Verrucomicrobiales bacterium]|nr:thiolase family protein [Verrucomicrobiales bacterium]